MKLLLCHKISSVCPSIHPSTHSSIALESTLLCKTVFIFYTCLLSTNHIYYCRISFINFIHQHILSNVLLCSTSSDVHETFDYLVFKSKLELKFDLGLKLKYNIYCKVSIICSPYLGIILKFEIDIFMKL